MDERSARIERRLEVPVLIATVLVIPLLIIEDSDPGAPWSTVGIILNWGTWLVFLAEAVIMLAVVPDKRRWVREHPLDIAVVVLTPPFLVALAPLRFLRLLRLLRLLRVARYARRVFSMEGLRYTALLAALTAVGGGAAFAAFEKDVSTADGMYWAVTTMTTVGYGDPQPTSVAAKVLAVFVMLVGIGFVAILTGAIAQRFVAPSLEEGFSDAPTRISDEVLLGELRAMRARLGELESALRRR